MPQGFPVGFPRANYRELLADAGVAGLRVPYKRMGIRNARNLAPTFSTHSVRPAGGRAGKNYFKIHDVYLVRKQLEKQLETELHKAHVLLSAVEKKVSNGSPASMHPPYAFSATKEAATPFYSSRGSSIRTYSKPSYRSGSASMHPAYAFSATKKSRSKSFSMPSLFSSPVVPKKSVVSAVASNISSLHKSPVHHSVAKVAADTAEIIRRSGRTVNKSALASMKRAGTVAVLKRAAKASVGEPVRRVLRSSMAR